MKWIGISGSWRQTCPELESDVIRETRQLLSDGDGIVSGGALGVDFLATKTALQAFPDGSRVKIIIPAPVGVYAAHFRARASEGVISSDQAEQPITQLELVQSIGSLVTMDYDELSQQTYYARNSEVVAASDELLAFQVNGSGGVQDTVDKAQESGIPVRVFSYTI